METTELKDRIIALLDEKKAENIDCIDIAAKSSIADYLIIATGRNTPNVKALAEHLEEKLEPEGVYAARKEGMREGRWVVVDYNNIIVHIFNAETRDFYCLEKLWK